MGICWFYFAMLHYVALVALLFYHNYWDCSPGLLRVELRHHWLDLAVPPGKLLRAEAGVAVDAVHTGAAVLAQVVHAVVDVLLAPGRRISHNVMS